jgi:hypothetical protein
LAQSLPLLHGTSDTTPDALAKCATPLWKQITKGAEASKPDDQFDSIIDMLEKPGICRIDPFFTLISRRRDTQCTDPQDKLYNLLVTA